MKQTKIYILILMLLNVALAMGQSVSLQMRSEVEEGTKFQLTLVIKDMYASPPENLTLENCSLLYGPAISTSSSFTSVNGKTTSSRSINATYTFRADKASTITVPSITISDKNGTKYSTKQQKLTILPAGQRPSATARPNQSQNVGVGDRVSAEGHFKDDDMFVRISVDNHKVYEQEPIVATIKLYTKQSIKSFQMLTQPTFEGFLSEELDVNEPVGTETINGYDYRTAVLKRCVLYPQKSGRLSLSSGTYEVVLVDRVNVASGSFFPDFRLVEKTIKTRENVANINVLPLPTPQPASFDGAVGTFRAEVNLSSTTLHTNEPVTYTYKITGTGNIKYLKTPSLTMPAGIDMYTPSTDINARYTNGDITGTYTATYTLVPQEVGHFEIPPVQFSYFNPKNGSYQTLDLPGFDVNVAKGAGSANVEQRVISNKMTDIRHIHTIKSPLMHEVTHIIHQWWYWCTIIALVILMTAIYLLFRRQVKLNADVRGRRLARAMRQAMKRFKQAQKLKAQGSPKFYDEISQALWGYLSDKLGIPSSQLLRENVAEKLSQYGLDQDGINNIISILDECEMARFTPMNNETDMDNVYNKVVAATRSIENVKQNRKG